MIRSRIRTISWVMLDDTKSWHQLRSRSCLFRWAAVLVAIVFLLLLMLQSGSWVSNGWKIPRQLTSWKDMEDGALWRGLQPSQVNELSVLGNQMYVNYSLRLIPQNRNFSILIWKHGKFLERRHLKHFGSKMHDPFEDCSVRNCRLTYEDEDLPSADAVLFHLHKTKSPSELPGGERNLKQRWIFLTDESPYNTFLSRQNNKLNMYNGLFNWSMSFRMDSDIPVPYGRTLPLNFSEHVSYVPQNWSEQKTKFVAILGSNCGGSNHRWDYVKKLQKYIPVDVYGGCGPLKCEGHFTKDCPVLSEYKFYLAFENSNCREYITEKCWWNAFAHNAVPVVLGGSSKSDYEKLLPPGSFIYAEDFSSPEELATYLMQIDSSNEGYNIFFAWKQYFKVVNEHGYFETPVFHYCRLCEALNFNDPRPKVYNDLDSFWSVKRDCHVPKF